MDSTSNFDLPEKACGLCGNAFGCGAESSGCWCAEEVIDPMVTRRLQAMLNDCLCPDCLHTAAAGPSIVIQYPDGSRELLARAVRVDTQNFHEGMYDFYDSDGRLLRQISMNADIKWKSI